MLLGEKRRSTTARLGKYSLFYFNLIKQYAHKLPNGTFILSLFLLRHGIQEKSRRVLKSKFTKHMSETLQVYNWPIFYSSLLTYQEGVILLSIFSYFCSPYLSILVDISNLIYEVLFRISQFRYRILEILKTLRLSSFSKNNEALILALEIKKSHFTRWR